MPRVKVKRDTSGKGTQRSGGALLAVRERSGYTGVDEPVMSASTGPFCRWEPTGNSHGELRLADRCGRARENAWTVINSDAGGFDPGQHGA